jgi:methylenetetrahydrofolate dehydrogenase (NADP+)/methenyltetrahydrofolate cyclohydrolase
MTASLIDGKLVSSLRRDSLKKNIQEWVQQGHRPPGLAVVLIGTHPASTVYVANKRKACAEVGIVSHSFDLPEGTSQETLMTLIDELNSSEQIDGILIQLPLPQHINERAIIEHIKPEKDVDGFHPYNIGRLAQRNPFLRPCTPLGIMNLLKHYELDVKKKHALVVGASNIVGRPMSLELLLAGATVTIAHKFTQNLEELIHNADIIIIATGKKDVIDAEWLNKNQIIIDVGIHRLEDGSLRGDLDFKKALDKVAWITPVPGGVGPMTIVTLLENTMKAATKASIYPNHPNQNPHSTHQNHP